MSKRVRSALLRAFKIALAVFLVAFLWLAVELVRGPVEPVAAELDLAQPLASGSAPPAGFEGAPQTAPADALRVTLSFEEGAFRIVGGGSDGALRIGGQYDSANYELETLLEDPEEGAPHYDVRLYRKISLIRSLLTSLKYGSVENRVRVELPEGVPLDLTLILSKGEHSIDLSGLSIARLEIQTHMGEAEVVFSEPNPIEMSVLEVRLGMGEFTARGLGHANARAVVARGSMGEQFLDFEGTPRVDTDLVLDVTMGAGHVRVPESTRIEIVEQSSVMGEISVGGRSIEGPGDPLLEALPTLRLDLGVRMGEISVRRR